MLWKWQESIEKKGFKVSTAKMVVLLISTWAIKRRVNIMGIHGKKLNQEVKAKVKTSWQYLARICTKDQDMQHGGFVSPCFTFTYPIVWWTVGALQMTWQPAPSNPIASQPSSWRRPASCLSIPGCCPSISFSVCLSFSLLALCPAGLSWQALKILLRARTISICVAVFKGFSWGPMACRVLFRTSSLEMWSL